MHNSLEVKQYLVKAKRYHALVQGFHELVLVLVLVLVAAAAAEQQ